MPGRELSINQVVAFNLRRLREATHQTQEQVAVKLEQYLGVRWSSAVFSLAERSVDRGARRREFDANELVALACVFHCQAGELLMPPPGEKMFTCDDQGDASRMIGRGQLEDIAATSSPVYITAELTNLRVGLDRIEAAVGRKRKGK